jgi:hypothetical protein
MARRASRKRRKPGAAPPRRPAPDPAAALERGYARSRRRDDEARAALEPLAPGERPRAVTVATIAAVELAAANLTAMIASYDSSEGGKTASTIVGTLILLVVAVGMWRVRYWAVLGMQALLAITMILSALALLTAASAGAALLAVVLIALSGTLFWFLVRALARIQMPGRPGA